MRVLDGRRYRVILHVVIAVLITGPNNSKSFLVYSDILGFLRGGSEQSHENKSDRFVLYTLINMRRGLLLFRKMSSLSS